MSGIPGRFYLWLKQQSERDHPIGDLSVDASQDFGFPDSATTKQEIRRYLGYVTSGPRRYMRKAVLATLDEAWLEFERFDVAKRRNLSAKRRFGILKRDGFRCRLCGRCAPHVMLEVDHTVAVSKGGTSDETNLMTLCFDCNRGKGTSDLAI